MGTQSRFAFHDAPTIEERVALGRHQNSSEGGAIVPFPPEWRPENLMAYFRFRSGAALQALLREGYELGAMYQYTDPAGAVIGLAQRLDHSTLKKKVLPLRATSVDLDRPVLEVRAIAEPRPLYNLQALVAADPERWIMVVEGEKAADAAKLLFPDHVVTTWSGGSKAGKLADFRPLAGRKVVIWPDHDKPGWQAAEDVGRVLQDLSVTDLRVVQTPEYFPSDWDVADLVPAKSDG